jgi:hypothetical protein
MTYYEELQNAYAWAFFYLALFGFLLWIVAANFKHWDE